MSAATGNMINTSLIWKRVFFFEVGTLITIVLYTMIFGQS